VVLAGRRFRDNPVVQRFHLGSEVAEEYTGRIRKMSGEGQAITVVDIEKRRMDLGA
jgi:hypothetical protein